MTADLYVEFMKGRGNKLWNFGGFVCELDFKNGKIKNAEVHQIKMIELVLDNYKVQTQQELTVDIMYILTEIEYEGNKRRIVILFSDKTEEPNLNENEAIKVIGEIEDDGIEYDLTMRNAKVE